MRGLESRVFIGRIWEVRFSFRREFGIIRYW